jgi:hypothetical protein
MENMMNDEINYPVYLDESREIGKQEVYQQLKENDTLQLTDTLEMFVQYSDTSDRGFAETVENMAAKGLIQDALNENEKISKQQKTISLTKGLNEIILNAPLTSDSTNYNFDESELKKLQQIASLCPYEYGNAVYMARAVLSNIDTTIYINECEESEGNNGEKRMIFKDNANKDIIISIYPNPAQSELHIDFNRDVYAKIELMDYLGKVVLIRNIKDLNNIIPIQNCNSGVYFLKVSTDIAERNEKIIIIR